MKPCRCLSLVLGLILTFGVTGVSPAARPDPEAPAPSVPSEFSCSSVTEIPEIECEAVVALYDSTNGPGWIDSTGWLATNTPCSWKGVSCFNGHVTSIDLIDNQLTGSIPPALGSLASLQGLRLGGNQLSDSIPAELGSLANLQYLWLNSNQLSGSIPPELGSLANLLGFDLTNNQLSGSIPPALGSLASLEGLWLRSNQLTGSIPPELGNLVSLQALWLSNNQLSGSIPPELGNLANLRHLWLYSNQLSGSIPHELGSLASLVGLYLESNQLSGGVPDSLCNPASLSSLDLGYNKLTGAAACITAKDPDWAATQTVPPAGVAATAEWGTRVALSWTPIAYSGDGGYYEVSYATAPGGPYSLHGTTSDKSATGYLVGGLAAEKPYYFVVRTYTPAHGDQQNALWSELSSEVAATTLPVSDFCDDVSEIPESECEALVAFYDSTNGPGWNARTGWLATNTPCSWSGVYCLTDGHVTDIRLPLNQLTGSIPPALGNLTSLWTIFLSSNQLSGSIPPTLGNLANLQSIELNGNQLSGSIPPELGSLANLWRLDLSYNQLTGSIPPALGSLAGLQSLWLNSNQLSGPLPRSLMTLSPISFYFDNTSVCEPPDPAFQAWLLGIPGLRRTGVLCKLTSMPLVFR